MNIVAISDLHGYLPDIPACDLFIIAGDICPNLASHPDKDRFRQAAWLDKTLRPWLESIPATKVVAIWGNHDWVGQHSGLIPADLQWGLLQDSDIVIDGFHIWGTPWTPICFNWSFMESERQLEERWKAIPKGIDILISHGPPYGYCDKPSPRESSCGSKALLSHMERINPKLLVCGHIHGGRGDGILPCGGKIINAAYVDEAYQPVGVLPAFGA